MILTACLLAYAELQNRHSIVQTTALMALLVHQRSLIFIVHDDAAMS
jgi:hypothetical protein